MNLKTSEAFYFMKYLCRMKHMLLVPLLLFSTLIHAQKTEQGDSKAVYDAEQKRLAETIGKPYPAFSVKTDSATISNESGRGKTVFINFWFESCAPCIAEFDALEKMYEKLKDSSNIIFLGLTYETPEKIKAVKKRFGITWPMAHISMSECYRLNMNNGFPTSIILDHSGMISYIHTGGSTVKDVADEFVRTELYPRLVKE